MSVGARQDALEGLPWRPAPPSIAPAAAAAVLIGVIAVALAVLLGGRGAAQPAGPAAAAAAVPASAVPGRIGAAYGRLPLRFEANRGQTDKRVRFVSRGAGYTLFLTSREAVLSLMRPDHARGGHARGTRAAVVRMRLLGANPNPQVAGLGRQPGHTNYLSGKGRAAWRTNVPGFARVRYRSAYPGIDLLYHGRRGTLEYDFVVHPGADPGRIGLGIRGARRMAIDRSGDLVLSTSAGRLRQHAPVIYQTAGGRRQRIAGRYVMTARHRVGFRVGHYDRARPLVIDPAMDYSTFLGGAFAEDGQKVAVDGAGRAYVAGATSSLDFPVTAGALDTSKAEDPADPNTQNSFDAFVARLNPQGTALEYSTYLGGSDLETTSGIAVDGSGRAYVAGVTLSNDFPTRNALRSTLQQPQNGFLSVLNATGSGLDYSTYLGGADPNGFARGDGLAVDSSGMAYVTGYTNTPDFPVGPAGTPFESVLPGGGDTFVAKLDPSASGAASRVWATFFGGTGYDFPADIAVDASGNSYVTGRTSSTDLPLQSAAQSVNGGGDTDGFVAELNPQGSGLGYSTYLGGSSSDELNAVAVDAGGGTYVTGRTTSTDLPTTPGAFQTARTGDPANADAQDATVARLNAGGALGYSTYLGGSAADAGHGIAVDGGGAAYVIGESDEQGLGSAPGAGFPTVDPFAPSGPQDEAFVTKVRPDGTGLSYSSTFGGGNLDLGNDIALDSAGSAYLVGQTTSTDFPTLSPLQAANAGGGQQFSEDAFVAKLSAVGASAPLVTKLGRRSGPAGTSVRLEGHGFSGASQVRFGTVAATTFTVDSDGQITAESPPLDPGAVAVTVTTPAGTSPANPIARFTYAEGLWDATGSRSAVGRTTTRLADGRVLASGGEDANQVISSAEVFDPGSGSWTPTGAMTTPREVHTATLLADGRVLAAGGYGANGKLASAELYDPATGDWTPTGPMGKRRTGNTATLLTDGRVLVTGGSDSMGNAVRTAELYDPGTKTWSAADKLAVPRVVHTATLLDAPQCHAASPPAFCGDVLVVGGTDTFEREYDTAELYDVATDTWTSTGSLAVGRSSHTATLLRDGRVLIAGGRSKRFADLYDPTTGQFSPTSQMATPRSDQAATLLASGKVLVAGGVTFDSVLNSAEVYDPAVEKWASAGLMTRYRRGGPGTLGVFAFTLPSGKVLVGGDGGFNTRSAEATSELYTPPPAPTRSPTPPGPGAAPGPGAGPGRDTTRPVVSGLRVSPARFRVGSRLPRLARAARVGTRIRFSLSEPATVKLAFAARRAGRRAGKRCRPATRRLRHRRRCTRFVAASPRVTINGARAGVNTVRFQGRLSRRRTLRRGSYRLTATATDAAGNRSRPKHTKLAVTRHRRKR